MRVLIAPKGCTTQCNKIAYAHCRNFIVTISPKPASHLSASEFFTNFNNTLTEGIIADLLSLFG